LLVRLLYGSGFNSKLVLKARSDYNEMKCLGPEKGGLNNGPIHSVVFLA